MDDITLVDYDPLWPTRYEEESALLRAALPGGLILDMAHVGSTAVPGLCAKPIIDIVILVASLAQARQLVMHPLEQMSYQFWKENPKVDRLFFVKGLPPWGNGRTHHVHLAERGTELDLTITFRDFLRTHTDSAQRYAVLKRDLALTYRTDREGYTAAKSSFIADCLRQAPSIAPSSHHESCC